VPTAQTLPAATALIWAQTLDLAERAGVPRSLLEAVCIEQTTAPRSLAGGHTVWLGTAIRPAYQIKGDLLEVLLHELGHCVQRAGTDYSGGPASIYPQRAGHLRAAEAAWCAPWERKVNEYVTFEQLVDLHREAAPVASLDAWWAAAQADPTLAAGYADVGPSTPYGATNSSEDFAETFVLWCADRARLNPTAAGRMGAWAAVAFGGL